MIISKLVATFNFFKVSKFFIYAALFSVVLVNTETLFPFIVTKYVFLRIAVGLALILFLLGWFFLKKEESKIFQVEVLNRLKSPLVIAVSIFVFVFLLAGFFGFNPQNSFWSNFERGEGGFQLLTFYVFFLLLVLLFKYKKDWQTALWVSLAAAVVMISYGILAALGTPGLIGPELSFWRRFQGSLGNPAYVGTYLMFIIGYSAYLFVSEKRWRILLAALILFYAVFFWLAQTRGAFLGLAAGVFFFLLYLIFKKGKKWRWRGVTITIIFILLFVGTISFVQSMDYHKRPQWIRWISIDLSGVSFQSRLWTWEAALKAIQERPLLGWGPENFGRVFDKYFDTRHFIPGVPSDTWYDRAHNVFLDYLIAAGTFGLLSYISIFTVFYLMFFKSQKVLEESTASQAFIFAMPLAYLVQGIVIFDVLPIYLNLFLFLSFANYKFNYGNT